MEDVRDALMVGRNSEGGLVRRPLSPHLQIYRPQITSATSIFHRATGVGLAVGTLLLVAWLVAAATSPAAYTAVASFVGSWIGLVLLFLWTLALFYHFCNGLRHLAWDLGKGFTLSTTHASGKAVIIASVIFTIVVWAIGVWR